MKIVTFIADSPDHAQPVTDDAIRAVRDILEKSTSTVIPVASIQELWDKLPAANDADVIQIVGHAAPGRLLLGRTWTNVDEDANFVYVLDSDPFRHGVLFGRVPKTANVHLLGCALGEAGDIADGPTLIFDLARMWSNEVSAPVSLVNPQDFDPATGAYLHPKRFCVASKLTVTMPETPALVGTSADLRLDNLAITGVPILGRRATSATVEKARRAFAPQANQFAALFDHEIHATQLLAAPEIELGSSLGRVQLIANGKILRLETESRIVYLVPASSDATGMVARIVKATLTAAVSSN